MKFCKIEFLGALIFVLACAAFSAPNTAKNAAKQNIFVEPVSGIADDFIRGVDISSLSDVEKAGGKFYNDQGKEEDLFKILKDHGVNWVRLRVWNNPTVEGKPYGGGNNSVETDIPLAVRAKQAGLKLLVDFHYADSWADPAKQPLPQDWAKLNAKKLAVAVEEFTRESIKKFEEAGARPDMVQIGNELNNGFMWPHGKIWGDKGEKVGGFKGFTALLESASRGVRAAQAGAGKIKIVVHLADGHNNDLYRTIFDQVEKAKIDYDVIGLSFYTYWHGEPAALKANMDDLALRYGKELVVVETAYAFTEENGDDQGNVFMTFSTENTGFCPSVQGQATAVREIINVVANVKGGAGVFYWEPAWLPLKGAGLSAKQGNTWENQSMFDFDGRALPSLAVWNLVGGKGEIQNVWGGSAKNSSNFVPYSMGSPIKLVTQPGVAPKMPQSAKIMLSNDEEVLLPVKWDSVDWKLHTDSGIVKVLGSLEGSDFRPAAEVEISTKVNLLSDPSFESGKWGNWKMNGPGAACFMENNKGNAHSGNWTYKYWLATPFKSTLSQKMTGLENGEYVFSVWAMGGGGENQIRIIASGFDSADAKKQTSQKITNTGWNEWKQYELKIPVTSGQCDIIIYLDAKGDCWGNFDDVEFYKN